ncbi:MAG: hypothetical protein KJ971_08585 [Firmicutes bacterium]|nr:hypothetical protein [Bacillota bacterium]
MPGFNPGAAIPTGLICMWHGLLANIPGGWALCDGTGGTPNLLARFVQGVATDATNPGATGGSTAKTAAASATDTPEGTEVTNQASNKTHTHAIADIRPLFYDVAFIMKT